MLEYITPADRAYIAHDLPESTVRDLFAPRSGEDETGARAIAVAALRLISTLLGGGMIFRVAMLRSFFLC